MKVHSLLPGVDFSPSRKRLLYTRGAGDPTKTCRAGITQPVQQQTKVRDLFLLEVWMVSNVKAVKVDVVNVRVVFEFPVRQPLFR